VSRLSFRARLFLALLVVSVLPVAVLTGGVVLVLGAVSNSFGGTSVEAVGETAKAMNSALNGIGIPGEVRLAIDQHLSAVNTLVTQTNRAEGLGRLLPAWLGGALTLVALGLLAIAAGFVRVLSRQLAGPLDEIVQWTGKIRRREALPADPTKSGIPEFALLRGALRDLAQGLEQARVAELEAERLRAFGEVARRVAHEMKNPLTPIRFAVTSLSRNASPDQEEALDVLRTESTRLEQLARDFANLGRLPEGPPAEVDLGELLGELLRTSLPAEITWNLAVTPETPHVVGHYDALRRAFANVIRNAAEAMLGEGRIEVTIRPWEAGVRVSVADQGPGIALEKRSRVFEPYFTEKTDGTGLGLAIVKQSVDLHQGVIEVAETPGGGATFVIWLPLLPESAKTRPADRPYVERRVADRRKNER